MSEALRDYFEQKTPLKLEVGKCYKLANGSKARIDAIIPENNPAIWPVIGVDLKDGSQTYSSWKRDGSSSYKGYNIISEWVEPKVPRTGEMWFSESLVSKEIFQSHPNSIGNRYWTPSFKIRWEEIL
jgi:hypothetical protein